MPLGNLRLALAFLEKVIRNSLENHFHHGHGNRSLPVIPIPDFNPDEDSPFTHFLREYRLTKEELTTVLLALMPHVAVT